MVKVIRGLEIDDGEIRFDFVRSSGPGGQNVNKVATAVQLRFDVASSPSLSDDIRERLVRIAGRRMTSDGVLVIDARRYRTQERNRRDAVDRLVKLIARAAAKPKRRKPTSPSRASRQRRLDEKRKRGDVKKQRRPVGKEEP